MLFSSHIFIFIFLPIAAFGYFSLNRMHLTKASKIWLIFASLFFYSWWNIDYLPLIVISLFVNYYLSHKLIEYESFFCYISKKNLLILSLVFNISFLAYFKYMDFFIENFNVSFDTNISLLHLALPLGISFYTLQQIAYVVDSYQGLIKEKSFLNYAIFVTFFPQLIAGPIVHHKEMMPQFFNLKNKVFKTKNIAAGIFIFSIGLFKKIVIADSFAVWATQGFDHTTTLNFIEAWVSSLSYTFQLYFDFSGYSDMAIGAALLFNIRLPMNFNSPLKSHNIIEFWKRWHITLSNFITNYIYTPILFSIAPLSFKKAMLTTLVTMLIAGLWHGASWMFVIFGFMHGLALVINHYWKKTKIKLPAFVAWFITFNFINLSLVVFRANDISALMKLIYGMCGLSGITLPSVLASKLSFLNSYGIEFVQNSKLLISINGDYMTIVWLTIAFFVVTGLQNSMQMLEKFKLNYKTMLLTYVLFVSSVLSMDKLTEFIYFNF